MKLFRIRIQSIGALILFGTTVIFAATPKSETAEVERTGEHARIFADTYRPLRSVAGDRALEQLRPFGGGGHSVGHGQCAVRR
jgi:hypothetical protein